MRISDIAKRLILLLSAAALSCAIYTGIKLPKKDTKEKDLSPAPHFYPALRQKESDLFVKQEVEYPFSFIVYGDSREPAGEEKEAIIRRIITEKPSFVIHLGDMVTYGEAHQWEIFDTFEKKIIDAGIPFYPVLGNHEYYTSSEGYPADPARQLQYYFQRFPFLEGRRWYSFKYANSGFVVLDTNTDYSGPSPQRRWFIDRLKEAGSEFLFVCLHHPPYTKNEKKALRRSEGALAEVIEGHWGKGLSKADIVFSSHTHNYERYLCGGINYVVSGGGGAPQYTIGRDADDFYAEEGNTYHYCKVTVLPTQVMFEMFKLIGDDIWTIADSFVIQRMDVE